MATNINLDVALNLDDSQYKSGVKSVEQSLKKFSTTPAFVKLKLDEGDFRKQYQDLVKASIKEIDKLNALEYKTKGGAVKIANSSGTMQSAYKYHLEMSQNEKLSKAERNRHAASELALRRHLNLISLIGLETKAQAKIQAQERAMPARLEQAKRSGQVAAAKKRAYDAEFAEEKRQKKDDELYRRRYLAFAAEESKIERERAARIAQLQREADQRAKATRNQYDQSIAAGTDTRTPELDALRRQYQEEERLAANAAKMEKQHSDESAKQLSNRVKARRKAKDIEVALENEKIAREKVSAAQERTNANRTKENIEKEIKALKDLKRAEDDLDKAQGKRKRNNRVSSATNQRIQELQTELDALRNNSNELDKQSGLLKRLGSLAARYFSIQQIVQFGRKIAETTGYFQKQQVALEGILQSATDARKVLNDISNFALQSPFRTDELVRFTKQLSAFGIDTADLFPTVKQLADISAGLGVDMDRIILAYGQVKSAAVLRGQELRQFTEAGIPMIDELAKRFTALNGELVTTADVFDLISKRQVPFEMVAKVMADMTAEGGRFYKMQENITETMHGQMEKLKDIWTLSLNDIGKSSDGFFMGIIKGLQVIAKNTKSVAWGMAAAFASGVVTKLIRWIGVLNGRLIATQAELKKIKVLKQSLSSIKGGLLSAGISIAIGAALGLISKAIAKSKEWEKTLKDINSSFAKDTAKTTVGFERLIERISASNEGTKEFSDAVSTLMSNYGDFVNDNIVQALIKEARAAKEAGSEYRVLAESIKNSIEARREWERHNEIKNTAGENLLKELNAFKLFKQGGKRDVAYAQNDPNSKQEFDYLVEIEQYRNILKSNDFQTAFEQAFTSFIEAGETSMEELASRLTRNLRYYGFSDSIVNWVQSNIERIYQGITNNEKWKTYLREVGILKNDPNEIIQNRFAEVDKQLRRRYKALTGEGAEYNPFGIDDEQQRLFVKEYINLLKEMLPKDQYNRLYSSQEFKSAINLPISDYGRGKAILEAVYKYKNTLVDGKRENETDEDYNKRVKVEQEVFDTISTISNAFLEFAGTLSTTAATIRTNASSFKGFEKFTLTSSDKDIIAKWTQVTDQNVNEKRSALWERIDKLDKDIKTNTGVNAYAEQLKKDKRERELLTVLLDKLLYYGDKPDNDSNRQELPTKITDLFSEMKNAYTRYKEVVQKGGIEYGLGYVRNDEQFQKMFGQFFGGAEGEKFKNEYANLEIGSKTVGELFQGKFLDGLENGVLDFEGALLEVIGELEEYGNADKENRKAYLQAAKQLKQWVDTNFSKDNLSATLDELEKAVKDLTLSFEKTNKAVDLYRQLQKNGTVGALGGQLGITRKQALSPDSLRQAMNVQDLINIYNSKLPEGATGISIGSLSDISSVYKAIEEVGKITKMNNENFTATAMGKTGDDVTNLLKQLLETLIKEAASISGEVYTGNAMQDIIANAIKRTDSEHFTLVQQQNVARGLGTYDMGAIKTAVNATQEEAQKIFDQFVKDNRLDVIAQEGNGKIDTEELDELESKLDNLSKDFPATLRDELMSKLTDLRTNVSNYNASVGAWGSFGGAIRDYRDADKIAKEEYNKEIKNNRSYQAMLVAAKSVGDPEEIDRINVALAASSERLKEMGVDGKNLAEDLRNISLENMQKSIQATQNQFSSMVDSVNAVVDAAKAFAQTINKVYDVLNDGENPEWMQEMEGFLGDFGDAFSAMVAPMMAVISLVATLTTAFVACEAAMTPILIAMAVIIAIAAIVAGIVAAAQAHDRKLQNTIEDLEKQMEDTQNAMTNLNAAAERMVGIDKFGKQLEANAKNLELYRDALKKAEAEEAKKDTDTEKLKEYRQEAQEYHDEFLNNLKDQVEEITFSVEDLAGKISDAMRSAFQSGENAARAMRDAVKESIGDIIQNLIDMVYLKPAIESVFQDFLGMSYEDMETEFKTADGKFDHKKATEYFIKRAKDPEAIASLESGMEAVTQGNIDIIDALDPILKEYYAYSGSQSSLSGGISGISEDTARSLEGLSNSILMQQVIANGHLSSINDQFMAVVQTNWFNQMLTHTKNIDTTMGEVRSLLQNFELGSSKIHVKMS